MAKFVTSNQAKGISAAAVIALLLSGLGVAVWSGMGAGWRHEAATPQQQSLSLRLTSLLALTAASTANTNTQTASATSDSRSAGQADSGGSTTSEAVAEASAGAASGDAGPERFRLPSEASYSKLQADPEARQSSPELAAEFEAAPWLLPARTKALPYAGVTDFDALVDLRAAEVPGLNTSKAVSFLTSTLHDPLTTALTQNCILYFHAYCNSPEAKVVMLKEQALWFMDVDAGAGWCPRKQGSELEGAVECKPWVWRQPKLELPVTRCARDLALYHERPSYDRRMLWWRGAG
ncbi:hypothetical protein ABPG77_005435 [Micractinium sp. CCAP 211/92]